VVLRRTKALVVPDDVSDEQLKAAQGALRKAPAGEFDGALVETWMVVGEDVPGSSKTKAIEQVAGKPGTFDARPGAYKAPGVSAWAGGALYERPPEPLIERKALD
jgi:hypothetical protein